MLIRESIKFHTIKNAQLFDDWASKKGKETCCIMASLIRQTCLITLFITPVLIVLFLCKRQTLRDSDYNDWAVFFFVMALGGVSLGGSPAPWRQGDAPAKIPQLIPQHGNRKLQRKRLCKDSINMRREQSVGCFFLPCVQTCAKNSMISDYTKEKQASKKHIHKVCLKYHAGAPKPNSLLQFFTKECFARPCFPTLATYRLGECRSPLKVMSDCMHETNVHAHWQIDPVRLHKITIAWQRGTHSWPYRYLHKDLNAGDPKGDTQTHTRTPEKSRWRSKSRWPQLIRRKRTFTSLCWDDNDSCSSPLGCSRAPSGTSEEEAEWLVGRGLALQVDGAQ